MVRNQGGKGHRDGEPAGFMRSSKTPLVSAGFSETCVHRPSLFLTQAGEGRQFSSMVRTAAHEPDHLV